MGKRKEHALCVYIVNVITLTYFGGKRRRKKVQRILLKQISFQSLKFNPTTARVAETASLLTPEQNLQPAVVTISQGEITRICKADQIFTGDEAKQPAWQSTSNGPGQQLAEHPGPLHPHHNGERGRREIDCFGNAL